MDIEFEGDYHSKNANYLVTPVVPSLLLLRPIVLELQI